MRERPTDFDRTLHDAKRGSTAQLLFRCARLVNEQALDRVRWEGQSVRPAHTALFPYIELDGTRLTELARRVGTSKQAVGQLVDDLQRMGLVERVADPEDGRAKLVRWTERGRAGLLEGLAALRALEAELEGAIGAARWRGLHGALLALDDHLTAEGGKDGR